jgi:hypothetical protein
MSEWLLFNAFLWLYHGEYKLHFAAVDDDNIHFVLDQRDQLGFYSVSSLIHIRHVALIGHIILIPSTSFYWSGLNEEQIVSGTNLGKKLTFSS